MSSKSPLVSQIPRSTPRTNPRHVAHGSAGHAPPPFCTVLAHILAFLLLALVFSFVLFPLPLSFPLSLFFPLSLVQQPILVELRVVLVHLVQVVRNRQELVKCSRVMVQRVVVRLGRVGHDQVVVQRDLVELRVLVVHLVHVVHNHQELVECIRVHRVVVRQDLVGREELVRRRRVVDEPPPARIADLVDRLQATAA